MAFNIRSIMGRNSGPNLSVQDTETANSFGINSKRGIRKNIDNIRSFQNSTSQNRMDEHNGVGWDSANMEQLDNTTDSRAALSEAGRSDKLSMKEKVVKGVKSASKTVTDVQDKKGKYSDSY